MALWRSDVSWRARRLCGRPASSASFAVMAARSSASRCAPSAVKAVRFCERGWMGVYGFAINIQGPICDCGVVRGGSRVRKSGMDSESWRPLIIPVWGLKGFLGRGGGASRARPAAAIEARERCFFDQYSCGSKARARRSREARSFSSPEVE